MTKCSVAELTSRGCIRISGTEAKKFLQDIVTNDVDRAVGGKAVHAALLTPQGKILFDFFLLDQGGHFLMECAKTIKLGFGMPAMKNDEIIIPALLEKGVSPADAYNYAIVGCIEVGVPGKWGYRVTGMSFLNILKILEITLNNGADPKTGLQSLPGKGTLKDFQSFEPDFR